MATVRKRGDSWRAEIMRAGHRESRTFATRAEAEDWAIQREAEIVRGEAVPRSRKTLAEALARIEPRNRTDKTRAAVASRYTFASVPLPDVTPEMLANWRDARLRQVSPGTVLREMTFLRGVFERARLEWRWIAKNPLSDVKRPPEPPARKRLISDAERDAMLVALDYTGAVTTVHHEVAVALLLALETGMRAGEILGLTRNDVDLEARTASLPRTKNGDSRQVPLSTTAVALIRKMLGRRLTFVRVLRNDGRIFHIDGPTLDTLFRRAREQAGLEGFTFHDSRATAVTRLSKKLDIHELARMIGHRDLNSLNAYYRTPASEIARRLD
jgi:integrase